MEENSDDKKAVVRLKTTSGQDGQSVDSKKDAEIGGAPTRPKLEVITSANPTESVIAGGQKIRLKTPVADRDPLKVERKPVVKLVSENDTNLRNANDTIRVVPADMSEVGVTMTNQVEPSASHLETVTLKNNEAPNEDTGKIRVVKSSTPTVMLNANDDILKEDISSASMATVNMMGSVSPDDVAPKKKETSSFSAFDLILTVLSGSALAYAVYILVTKS